MTFDNEAAQLKCLHCTSMGTLPRMLNMTTAEQKKHTFRSGKMLEIVEASEPSAILWENIGVGGAYGGLRTQASRLVFYMSLIASFLATKILSDYASEQIVVFVISVMNVVFPLLIRHATEILEIHEDQETMQVIVYTKHSDIRMHFVRELITRGFVR